MIRLFLIQIIDHFGVHDLGVVKADISAEGGVIRRAGIPVVAGFVHTEYAVAAVPEGKTVVIIHILVGDNGAAAAVPFKGARGRGGKPEIRIESVRSRCVGNIIAKGRDGVDGGCSPFAGHRLKIKAEGESVGEQDRVFEMRFGDRGALESGETDITQVRTGHGHSAGERRVLKRRVADLFQVRAVLEIDRGERSIADTAVFADVAQRGRQNDPGDRFRAVGQIHVPVSTIHGAGNRVEIHDVVQDAAAAGIMQSPAPAGHGFPAQFRGKGDDPFGAVKFFHHAPALVRGAGDRRMDVQMRAGIVDDVVVGKADPVAETDGVFIDQAFRKARVDPRSLVTGMIGKIVVLRVFDPDQVRAVIDHHRGPLFIDDHGAVLREREEIQILAAVEGTAVGIPVDHARYIHHSAKCGRNRHIEDEFFHFRTCERTAVDEYAVGIDGDLRRVDKRLFEGLHVDDLHAVGDRKRGKPTAPERFFPDRPQGRGKNDLGQGHKPVESFVRDLGDALGDDDPLRTDNGIEIVEATDLGDLHAADHRGDDKLGLKSEVAVHFALGRDRKHLIPTGYRPGLHTKCVAVAGVGVVVRADAIDHKTVIFGPDHIGGAWQLDRHPAGACNSGAVQVLALLIHIQARVGDDLTVADRRVDIVRAVADKPLILQTVTFAVNVHIARKAADRTDGLIIF